MTLTVALDSVPSSSPLFENVHCYQCGSTAGVPLIEAEDDLTGKPGRFRFVKCPSCGLAYQNPRISLSRIR
jgi:ribosomal protein S27E